MRLYICFLDRHFPITAVAGDCRFCCRTVILPPQRLDCANMLSIPILHRWFHSVCGWLIRPVLETGFHILIWGILRFTISYGCWTFICMIILNARTLQATDHEADEELITRGTMILPHPIPFAKLPASSSLGKRWITSNKSAAFSPKKINLLQILPQN